MLENIPSLAPPLRRVHPRVGPYSKQGAVALLDGRSREAQYMKRKRAELTAYIGSPNAVQRQMIERAVRLSLQLELMDERLTHCATFETRDHNHLVERSDPHIGSARPRQGRARAEAASADRKLQTRHTRNSAGSLPSIAPCTTQRRYISGRPPCRRTVTAKGE